MSTELLFDRPLYRYGEVELEKIRESIAAEARSGARTPVWDDVQVGQEIPTIVRGPLTIGDMVCWQAAIGPSYRAGGLGYLDVVKAPHTAVKNPITGWLVKYSQQHEDPHLAAQRGMPGPFDNGVMRFAWVGPLVTNWMGDGGFLRRLYVQVKTPAIYADTAWYQGTVTGKSRDADGAVVKIGITGINQVGITTTTGEAEIVLPTRSGRS